jgi:hypothetical protein
MSPPRFRVQVFTDTKAEIITLRDDMEKAKPRSQGGYDDQDASSRRKQGQ